VDARGSLDDCSSPVATNNIRNDLVRHVRVKITGGKLAADVTA
jgi:hypothetical protein